MDKKTQQNFTYYVLAILGFLLIVLPFFFLDFSTVTVGDTALRLGLHAAAFGGAVVTAGIASTVVVKAIQHPGFVKVASWSVASIAATSLVVAVIQLNPANASSTALAAQDSTFSDSSLALVNTDSLASDLKTDSSSISEEGVALNTTETTEPKTNETATKIPVTETKKTTVVETKTNTTSEPDKSGEGNCKDEDIGVFLAGKKVNLLEGFSFSNKSKNIRIGDECGCTATGTKVTVIEKGGKTKASTIIASPFFSLQSITALEATDRVLAEVDQVKCLNKEGISSLKKIKKLLINIVFKNDGETTVRKRAAKELQTTEETTPVKKNAVEEDALKYGN